jgi:hypothetical protein
MIFDLKAAQAMGPAKFSVRQVFYCIRVQARMMRKWRRKWLVEQEAAARAKREAVERADRVAAELMAEEDAVLAEAALKQSRPSKKQRKKLRQQLRQNISNVADPLDQAQPNVETSAETATQSAQSCGTVGRLDKAINPRQNHTAPPEKEPTIGESTDDTCCCVCQDEVKSVALIPCGHVCACPGCAPMLGCCPLCRQEVTNRLRVYL